MKPLRPLRIAFDVRPGNGGPARYVASLVRALTAPDWDVQFVDRPQPRELTAPLSRCPSPPRRLSRFVPRFARHWLGFRRNAMHLAGTIRAMPIDLFHTQNTGCEEMPVAARLAGVPKVLGTFHVDSTVDLSGERSGFAHRAMEWYSNRNLHLAIAVSEATKQDWMRRTGIPSERVVTIHNGIDPDHFVHRQSRHEARARLKLPQNAIILGGMGRIEPAKGFSYLIDALAALRSEFPDVWVAIAGDGSLREELEAKAQRLGVRERVTFLGFQHDVNLVLDACDVFVMPSLSETLGYALLEAMAHELPAVGTTVGGIPEVIVPGETGALAPPRDGASLAQAIRPLLDSAPLRERLGRAGRERVVKHFNEAMMVRKTIDVYRDLHRSRAAAVGRPSAAYLCEEKSP